MSLTSGIRKIAGIVLILLGIFILFVPVVGLFVGLPLLLLGIFLFWKKKKNKEYHSESSFISNLLLKIKPVTNSKKWIVFFILTSFLLLIFGSANYQLIYIGLILLFFIMYNKIKHEEWKISGKNVSAKWFHIRGRPARWFGAGVFSIIFGFLVLIGAIYVADRTYMKDASPTLLEYFGVRVAWGIIIGSVGIATIILGFWMIRFSYRNPQNQGSNFKVLEPGRVVISKKGIVKKS